MAFRILDQRRVQAAFDAVVPPPYDPVVTLTANNEALAVRVMDPARPDLTVASCEWRHDGSNLMARQEQPPRSEVEEIAATFVTICAEYVSPSGDA